MLSFRVLLKKQIMASIINISYNVLSNILLNNNVDYLQLTNYIILTYDISEDIFLRLLKDKVDRFFRRFQEKWKNSYRKKSVFLEANIIWLKREIVCDLSVNQSASKKNEQCLPHQRGRPKKQFEDCSDRRKRTRSRELEQSSSTQELQLHY